MNDATQLVTTSSPETQIRTVDGVGFVFYAGEQFIELGRKKALPDVWCHPEQGYTYGRCKMIKTDGDRCKNAVRAGWCVCHYHGAGRPSRPGGMNDKVVMTGRHGKHLPTRLVDSYNQYVNDPDSISLASEIALIDSRMAELLSMLDNHDVVQAWVDVRLAHRLLNKDGDITERTYDKAMSYLTKALSTKRNDAAVWKDVTDLIERRRKLADTERRRIVDAEQTMTYQEANMLIAFLMNSVMTHVQDPEIRRAISDDLKRVS